MKSFRIPVGSMVALLLLVTLAATAIGAEVRPLNLKGTTSIVSGDPFSDEGAVTAGTGTGTHLGEFESTGTVFFSAGKGKEKGFTVGVGEQTFVAANGVDSITAEFRGLLDSDNHAVIDFVITGGTGRFEGAEGGFVAEADAVGPGVFSFTAEGNIEY